MTEGHIDPMTLRDMLERGERVTVVDVRKGEDHAEWSIPAHALIGSVRYLLDLPCQTLVLPGHTSEPVPFDGAPISAPVSEVRNRVGPLLEDEDRFLQRVVGDLSPTPENYEPIVELNRSGEQPEDDPTELDAGANRCAAG